MPSWRAQIQTDLGLAEAVDGLHRVADHEQRAPVARLPAGSELGQQFMLAHRGILEFIDQQVANAVIEMQGQIGGRLGGAKGA